MRPKKHRGREAGVHTNRQEEGRARAHTHTDRRKGSSSYQCVWCVRLYQCVCDISPEVPASDIRVGQRPKEGEQRALTPRVREEALNRIRRPLHRHHNHLRVEPNKHPTRTPPPQTTAAMWGKPVPSQLYGGRFFFRARPRLFPLQVEKTIY